ncbi:MAG: hypothetical protein WD557_13395 [Dehalococcoidia bacterium]
MTSAKGNGASGPIGYTRGDVPSRPPVLLGCAALVAVVVAVILGGVCAAVFLESGADSGKVQLEDADAYAPGSITYNGEFNFFVVRSREGEFFALDDLDAANRANQGRRCRALALSPRDPDREQLVTRYQAAMSPQGRSLGIILRENCNGAVYDGLGVRLDTPGERNLDRFAVREASNGRLEVSTGERLCSHREEGNLVSAVDCD